ncbi:MAG TPA: SRPBCC family protein [Rhodoferax sp.]|nr:SRPBCC family protein [Rhodoferax sp.]HPW29819.1 SRPBCC family protein [Rhodoferax sp.]
MGLFAPDATTLHELVLTRLINVPRAKLFRCWTEPALITQWFTPPPWKTIAAEIDVRAGGSSCITMQGPDGTKVPNLGVYLEVVKNERLVFTDAYTSAWVPSGKPFFTGILTFEDEGGQTRYIARARHWTAEDCAAHEKMGFYEGWGIATDQLAVLAATL